MGIRDTAPLAGRAVLGGYRAVHGAQKLFGAFGAAGPGRYSVDGLTGLRLHRVLTGIVIAGAGGSRRQLMAAAL